MGSLRETFGLAAEAKENSVNVIVTDEFGAAEFQHIGVEAASAKLASQLVRPLFSFVPWLGRSLIARLAVFAQGIAAENQHLIQLPPPGFEHFAAAGVTNRVHGFVNELAKMIAAAVVSLPVAGCDEKTFAFRDGWLKAADSQLPE